MTFKNYSKENFKKVKPQKIQLHCHKKFAIERYEFVDMSGCGLKWGKHEYKKVFQTNSLIKAFFKFMKYKKESPKVRLVCS